MCTLKMQPADILRYWRHLVMEYSTLNFTKGTDRLVAIGGIAKKIQQASGFTYLAGLWLEDLAWSLIIKNVDPKDPQHVSYAFRLDLNSLLEDRLAQEDSSIEFCLYRDSSYSDPCEYLIGATALCLRIGDISHEIQSSLLAT
ncbi:hypothetical protein B0H63DRAFT_455717 [Podospora didyma]|uniref:Uncharacterized protein n=1 Tax=Podospora didyma TaxID=330526 RepID=A0AAE0N332_9PEZI|nr:hypothetical protein B0H63DRAFT_455717 [Podospora didyma]